MASPVPAARGVGPAVVGRRARSLRLLAHPATTAAFAVLAINDHVLKARFPGVVTGKLSDLAGLVGLTIVAGVVLGRPRTAALVVSVGFVALKTVPGAAELAAPLLGGVGVRDATDLLALLVVAPAAAWTEVHLGVRIGATTTQGRLGQVTGSVAALCVVLTTTATSCEGPPIVDGFRTNADGTALARLESHRFVDGRDVDTSSWAITADGGRTFERADLPSGTRPTSAGNACGGSGCFRVRGEAVEHQTSDGPWRTSFEFSSEQKRRADLRSASSCGRGGGEFSAVAIVRRPDGEHVLVAMGTEGVLHRTPGGTWERRAVLGLSPVPLHGPSWLAMRGLSLWLFAALGIGVFAIGWWRNGVPRGAAALLVSITGATGVVFVYLVTVIRPIDYTVYGPGIALISAVTFVLSLVVALLPWPSPPPAFPPPAFPPPAFPPTAFPPTAFPHPRRPSPHHLSDHLGTDPTPEPGSTAQDAWTLRRRLAYLLQRGAE
jgi:hypothetical protein